MKTCLYLKSVDRDIRIHKLLRNLKFAHQENIIMDKKFIPLVFSTMVKSYFGAPVDIKFFGNMLKSYFGAPVLALWTSSDLFCALSQYSVLDSSPPIQSRHKEQPKRRRNEGVVNLAKILQPSVLGFGFGFLCPHDLINRGYKTDGVYG